MLKAPSTIDELWARAQALSGLSIAELANELGIAVPNNLRREKGWLGQLLEAALGCSAGSLAMPDFPELGVELKTLPVDNSLKVMESTYVCTAPLKDLSGLTWANSLVREKLACVLWIPIEADKSIALLDRRILHPLLWQPNAEQERLLESDFNEHIQAIYLGQVDRITAKNGNVLQVRPKAANAQQLTCAIGPEGEMIQTLPRGFYLRPRFTQQILLENFQPHL